MKPAVFNIIFYLLLFAGCEPKKEHEKANSLFVRLSSKETGIVFENTLTVKEDFDVFRYRNFYNGGGVAIGDINNDGLPDLYLTSNMTGNRLYLNKGNWKFEDITKTARVGGSKVWSTGVTMADVNADGLLDIYVCNSGDINGGNRENELFINNGDLTFTERANDFGLADRGFSTHAVFFDYDKDGDLDCYVLNNSFRPISTLGYRNLRDERDEEGGDKLYKNNKGRFSDVSESANIYGSVIGFGLGVTVGDVNQDNWPDIYISNDFYERDYLYINNHDGTFSEKLMDFMGHLSMFSMGADLADINNDGYPDIFSTDMLPEIDTRLKTKSDFETYDVYQLRIKNGYYHQFMRNMLQVNNQDGTFREVGQLAKVDATDWSWGALIADFDNDSNKDIFVCNGIYKDVTDQDFVNFLGSSENMHRAIDGKKIDFKEFVDKMGSERLSNYMFSSKGDLQFKNKSQEWGLDEPSFSNGAAYGDMDNDGDLDLIVNNVNQELFVYKNQAEKFAKNNFISISFKGSRKNTFGIGAKISVYVDRKVLYQENIPTRGFQSSMDYRMTIGLGQSKTIDSVRITWPNDKSQTLLNVAVNKHLIVNESDATTSAPVSKKPATVLLQEVDMGRVVHKENQFNDFDQDRLLYHMLSTQGPAFAHADLNNDGLDDFFIGGAAGKSGSINLQKGNAFVLSDSKFLDADSLSEDIDAAFFDADGDKDLDLYVVSGGSEYTQQSSNLGDRLYENTGTRNGMPVFVKTKGKLPSIYQSGSCVRPADIDHDGDIDLFVGTRAMSRYYGMPCDQFILLNDGKGNFTESTQALAPELHQLGMVTDAQWFDYDNNGFDDLIIVGDWMPITIFKNDGKHLEMVKNIPGLENTNGWWNTVKPVDLDGDGDTDFIIGNLGLNSKFRPTIDSPISLYVNDFDQNGSVEPIFTYRKNGVDYPFALRQDILKQMSSLKKKFLYFKDYADKSLKDFVDPKIFEKSTVLHFYEPATSVLINNGASGFELRHLPIQAQYSPVFGIDLLDVNKDNKADLVLGGNLYAIKPEVGKYDAMPGLVLLGDGKGNFDPLPSNVSGVKLEGEVRRIRTLNTRTGKVIVFVRNNDDSKFYKLK